MSIRYDIVDKAKQDLGYTEGPNNDTKYGDWYGLPNQPWCAMAVSKWIDEVGVSQDVVKRFASCTAGYNWFKAKGQVRARGYYPKPGDIIFFIWEKGEPTPDHVGIVEYTDQGIVHTIEGNRSDKVQRFEYPVNDWRIYGYATPVYPDDDVKEENKVEEEEEMGGYHTDVKLDVYQTTECKEVIGSVGPNEDFACKEIFDGIYLAMYSLDGTNNKVKKCGFVKIK